MNLEEVRKIAAVYGFEVRESNNKWVVPLNYRSNVIEDKVTVQADGIFVAAFSFVVDRRHIDIGDRQPPSIIVPMIPSAYLNINNQVTPAIMHHWFKTLRHHVRFLKREWAVWEKAQPF